jgi:hypothetical protein
MDYQKTPGLPSINKVLQTGLVLGFSMFTKANESDFDFLNSKSNVIQESFAKLKNREQRSLQYSYPQNPSSGFTASDADFIFDNIDFGILRKTTNLYSFSELPSSTVTSYPLSYSSLLNKACFVTTSTIKNEKSPLSDYVCGNRTITPVDCPAVTLGVVGGGMTESLTQTLTGFLTEKSALSSAASKLCQDAVFVDSNDDKVTKFYTVNDDHNVKVNLRNPNLQKTFSYDISTTTVTNDTFYTHKTELNDITHSPIEFNIYKNNSKSLFHNFALEKDIFSTTIPDCNNLNLRMIDKKSNKQVELCNNGDVLSFKNNYKSVIVYEKNRKGDPIKATGIINNELRFIMGGKNFGVALPYDSYMLFANINTDDNNSIVQVCVEKDKKTYSKVNEIVDYLHKMQDKEDCVYLSFLVDFLSNIKDVINDRVPKDESLNLFLTQENADKLNNKLGLDSDSKSGFSETFYIMKFEDLLKNENIDAILFRQEEKSKRVLFETQVSNTRISDEQIFNGTSNLVNEALSILLIIYYSVILFPLASDFATSIAYSLGLISLNKKVKMLNWGYSCLYLSGWMSVFNLAINTIMYQKETSKFPEEHLNSIFSLALTVTILPVISFFVMFYKWSSNKSIYHPNALNAMVGYLQKLDEFARDKDTINISTFISNIKSLNSQDYYANPKRCDLNVLQLDYAYEIKLLFDKQKRNSNKQTTLLNIIIAIMTSFFVPEKKAGQEEPEPQQQNTFDNASASSGSTMNRKTELNLDSIKNNLSVFLALLIEGFILSRDPIYTLISGTPLNIPSKTKTAMADLIDFVDLLEDENENLDNNLKDADLEYEIKYKNINKLLQPLLNKLGTLSTEENLILRKLLAKMIKQKIEDSYNGQIYEFIKSLFVFSVHVPTFVLSSLIAVR